MCSALLPVVRHEVRVSSCGCICLRAHIRACPFSCAAYESSSSRHAVRARKLYVLLIFARLFTPLRIHCATALALAAALNPWLWHIWVQQYSGNANFVLATTIVHALALTAGVVNIVSGACD